MTNKRSSSGSLTKTGKSGGDKDGAASTSTPSGDKDNAAADKSKRFEGEGVVFKAKLIGSELVMEPRGDKMCQNSITRLKAIIKGTNSHKRQIVLKISFSGVRVYDEKTNEVLHDNEVSQISYIASDDSDNRCFGYVCDVPNKAHQFICFKTSGPAMQVMQAMSALFDAVLERKKQSEDGSSKGAASTGEEDSSSKGGKEPMTDLIIGDLSADEPTAADVTDQQIGGAAITGITASVRGFSFDDGFSDITTQSTPSLTQAIQQHSFASSMGATTGSQRFNQMNRTNSNSLDLIDDSGIMDNNNALSETSAMSSSGGGLIGQSAQAATGAPPIAIPSRQFTARQMQQQYALSGAQFNLHQQQHQHQQQQQQQHQQHQQVGRHNNRSLVYNLSSKSLSDAVLPRQSPGSGSAISQLAGMGQTSSSLRNDSFVDRYAVFNDIDNLPSIFESTLLSSLNGSTASINNSVTNSNSNIININNSSSSSNINNNNNNIISTANLSNNSSGTIGNSNTIKLGTNVFRQTNPFDEEFFS